MPWIVQLLISSTPLDDAFLLSQKRTNNLPSFFNASLSPAKRSANRSAIRWVHAKRRKTTSLIGWSFYLWPQSEFRTQRKFQRKAIITQSEMTQCVASNVSERFMRRSWRRWKKLVTLQNSQFSSPQEGGECIATFKTIKWFKWFVRSRKLPTY